MAAVLVLHSMLHVVSYPSCGRRIVCLSRRGKQEMANNVMVTLSYQSKRVVSNTNFSFTVGSSHTQF